MKRLTKLLLTFIILFVVTINVYAKDTVYSVNKYDDEKLIFIEDSYNKNNKKDGVVTVGTYKKEEVEKDDNKYDDYQIMLIKYKSNGKTDWTYRYGKTSSEEINSLLYTYDNNKINGYLMVISNSYDINSSNIPESIFVKIDLDGKLIEEKNTSLNSEEVIKKLIPTYSIDDIVDGYIGITNTSIIKYDKNLNLIYRKNIENKELIDIIDVYNEKELSSYTLITKEVLENNEYNIKLISYNKELTEEKLIKENIELTNPKLSQTDNGFIIYGITTEVKLKKSDTTYYLSKYNNQNEEEWESFGTIPLQEDSNLVLKSVVDKDKYEYFIFYKNIDNSFEVVTLDDEGLLKKKIKKINNNYYNFTSFHLNKNKKHMYFIGQINCLEDESCEYDNNSLFLISDEDKVIEVQDSVSYNTIIICLLLIVLIGVGIFYTKKKKVTK